MTCMVLVIAARPAWGLDAESISADNENAVLLIFGDKAGSDTLVQGSGCCVDAAKGLVLATAHQVRDAKHVKGLLQDGHEYALKVLAVDRNRDLAVLRAEKALPQDVELGDAYDLRNGASVLTISSPRGIAFSTNTGLVTNVHYERNGYPVLLTDLPLTPGSSGGPVFNEKGQLVGLVSGNLTEVDNTVVVPVNNAYSLLCAQGLQSPHCTGDHTEEPAMNPVDGASEQEQKAVKEYNRGVAATDPAAKVTYYKMATREVPAFFEAWFNLAIAETALDDLDSAIQAYDRAKTLKPGTFKVHRNLGQVLLRAGKTQAGADELKEAVRLAPDDERAHNDLGEAYRRLKQYEEAVAAFKRALELREDYPQARYNLGLTYAQMGNVKDAIENLQAYLKLSPHASDAAQVRAWIKKLEKDKG